MTQRVRVDHFQINAREILILEVLSTSGILCWPRGMELTKCPRKSLVTSAFPRRTCSVQNNCFVTRQQRLQIQDL